MVKKILMITAVVRNGETAEEWVEKERENLRKCEAIILIRSGEDIVTMRHFHVLVEFEKLGVIDFAKLPGRIRLDGLTSDQAREVMNGHSVLSIN